jgi:predicted RNA binding protein YcfA (HicA-like mRNA interferase family)
MGDVPVLKPREVAAILVSHGFVQVRQRGSHCQYRHPDGRARDIGMDVREFLARA